MRRQKRGEKVQLKGGVYEVNFGYNVKKEVYANSRSDIPKLSEIEHGASCKTNIQKLLTNNLIEVK